MHVSSVCSQPCQSHGGACGARHALPLSGLSGCRSKRLGLHDEARYDRRSQLTGKISFALKTGSHCRTFGSHFHAGSPVVCSLDLLSSASLLPLNQSFLLSIAMEVAGSAVGIASLGIQVCQGLLAYFDSWKDYGYDVAEARNSVSDLHDTLVLLEDNLQTGGLDAKRAARVTSCVQSCKDGIQDLGKKLDDLQKYSKPEGLRQKARAEMQKAVYPFRKDTLTKLRGNVADVRERLKLALQVLQLSVLQSDRWRKIVDWLAPSDPWTNHRSARQRHEPHTGDWLLQSPTYLDWKAGRIRHLWVYGKAGCGKTVLSSTMIEDMKKLCDADENLGRFGLGAFYFTFSDKQKQSYEDLLRSLVEQLAWKRDSFARLQQAYDSPNRGRPGKDELEKILLLSLQAYDQVFLALDALDESPEENDTRQTMLEQLERLVQNASNVKLLATSRKVRDIQESMEMLRTECINVADSKVDKDIRKYVVSELSKDRRLSRLSDKTISLIRDTLSARADGM